MATVTFDTYDFVVKMREAGFDEKPAEAVVRVVSLSQSELITTLHFDLKIEKELAPIKAELLVIKWMMGVLIAIAVANFAKQFF
jgi:hypothetical protein